MVAIKFWIIYECMNFIPFYRSFDCEIQKCLGSVHEIRDLLLDDAWLYEWNIIKCSMFYTYTKITFMLSLELHVVWADMITFRSTGIDLMYRSTFCSKKYILHTLYNLISREYETVFATREFFLPSIHDLKILFKG